MINGIGAINNIKLALYQLKEMSNAFCKSLGEEPIDENVEDILELKILSSYVLALEIIKIKGLPLVEKDMIKQSENYEQYCIKYSWCNIKNASVQKTEEEFKILKEAINYE